MNKQNPPDIINKQQLYKIIDKKLIKKLFINKNINSKEKEFNHIMRVIENCIILNEFEKGNINIILSLALFSLIATVDELHKVFNENKKHINLNKEEENEVFNYFIENKETKNTEIFEDAEYLDSLRNEIYPEAALLKCKYSKNSGIFTLFNQNSLKDKRPKWSIDIINDFGFNI